MIDKTVTFPTWPTWNYHFPELDVLEVVSVKYVDGDGVEQTLGENAWRLTIGRSGVSGIRFIEPNRLEQFDPQHPRADRVKIDYRISDNHEMLTEAS
jgi:hypothetical protein